MNIARFLRTLALGLLAALPAAAQQPNTLKHTFREGLATLQTATREGACVAAQGNLAAVGVPGASPGRVRVYNTDTGQLLHTLMVLSSDSGVGSCVAISGSRIVVGAPGFAEAGVVDIFDLASAQPEVPVMRLRNPIVNGDFGASVAISGTRVAVAGKVGLPEPDERVFVFDLASPTPTVPVLTIVPPVTTTAFAQSLAMDGNRLVVGTTLFSVSTSNSVGIAHVYSLAGATPTTPEFTLNNPTPAGSEYFGQGVAISGNRVVIGAYGDLSASSDGTAYVYNLAGTTPTVPAFTIKNPTPGSGDRFGYSVAISGTRVAVGAYRDTTGASSSGSAYVYDVSGAAPAPLVATINNPTPAASDHFAISVALSGTRLVAGAHQDDTIATDNGSSYAYELTSATPTVPLATLATGTPVSLGGFGRHLAMAGTWMVAADVNNRVYVYDLARATPTLSVFSFVVSGLTPSLSHAKGLALSGHLLVAGRSGAESASVYDLTAATPAVPILTLSNPELVTGDSFGSKVVIAGTRVVVSAPSDDFGGIDAGSVYVYDLSGPTPGVPILTLRNPVAGSANTNFGSSLAIHGSRLVVCAQGDTGKVYVFDLDGVDPAQPTAIFENPDSGTLGFARSVAISGSLVTVGSPYHPYGKAFLYDLNGANPTTPVTTFFGTDFPQSGFGSALAMSGSRLVIGAKDIYSNDNPGSAHVFDLASANPTTPVAIFASHLGGNDDLGWYVAIDGNTVAISASAYDGIASGRGEAYLYGPASNDTDGDGLLDIWEFARFGSLTAHTAVDDSDGDGRNELLELAFNADPTKCDLWAAPLLTNEGGFLTLTINKRAGASYLVETAGSPDDAAFSAATTTPLINNSTTLKVRDNFTPATAAERLIRVKVIAAP